jgi:AraC family transcriptional regulator
MAVRFREPAPERNMSMQTAFPATIGPSEPGSILPVLNKLLDDARGALEGDNATARSFLVQALTLLHQQDAPTRTDLQAVPIPPARGGLAPWQIRRVRAHIDAHLDGPIRAGELAAISRLSVSYFSVAFQRSFGVSLSVFLARLRVERAQAMMQSTSHKLSQIALACGFCDQAHLSRQFRRVVGTTPRRWRQENVLQQAA